MPEQRRGHTRDHSRRRQGIQIEVRQSTQQPLARDLHARERARHVDNGALSGAQLLDVATDVFRWAKQKRTIRGDADHGGVL